MTKVKVLSKDDNDNSDAADAEAITIVLWTFVMAN